MEETTEETGGHPPGPLPDSAPADGDFDPGDPGDPAGPPPAVGGAEEAGRAAGAAPEPDPADGGDAADADADGGGAHDGADPDGGPRPLGVGTEPTGQPAVDALLRRLADADHLAVPGHLEVYEDVHSGLRDTLTALDQPHGPPRTGPHDPRS